MGESYRTSGVTDVVTELEKRIRKEKDDNKRAIVAIVGLIFSNFFVSLLFLATVLMGVREEKESEWWKGRLSEEIENCVVYRTDLVNHHPDSAKNFNCRTETAMSVCNHDTIGFDTLEQRCECRAYANRLFTWDMPQEEDGQ